MKLSFKYPTLCIVQPSLETVDQFGFHHMVWQVVPYIRNSLTDEKFTDIKYHIILCAMSLVRSLPYEVVRLGLLMQTRTGA